MTLVLPILPPSPTRLVLCVERSATGRSWRDRIDELSQLGHLAAVGLVFMPVVAVNRELRARGFWTAARPEQDLLGLLDMVALGTIADVVPLRGLNRAF